MSNFKVEPQLRPEVNVLKIGDDYFDEGGVAKTYSAVSGIATTADIVTVDTSSFTTISGDNVQEALEQVDLELQNSLVVSGSEVIIDDSSLSVISGSDLDAILLSIDQKLAELDSKISTLNITTVTGTAYTLALDDVNSQIDFTNGAATTLTIPNNSTVAIPAGSQILGRQAGAGTVTVASGSGVTIQSADGELSTSAQFSMFSLIKVSDNLWSLAGDLA
jgi:hypothetical protein